MRQSRMPSSSRVATASAETAFLASADSVASAVASAVAVSAVTSGLRY